MTLIPEGLIVIDFLFIFLFYFVTLQTSGGGGVKPLQPPSNVVFDKLPALENASGADVVQGHKVKTL